MKIILSCPHCGNSASLRATFNRRHECFFTYVICNSCGAQAKSFPEVEDPAKKGWSTPICYKAVDAWNRRFDAGSETKVPTPEEVAADEKNQLGS